MQEKYTKVEKNYYSIFIASTILLILNSYILISNYSLKSFLFIVFDGFVSSFFMLVVFIYFTNKELESKFNTYKKEYNVFSIKTILFILSIGGLLMYIVNPTKIFEFILFLCLISIFGILIIHSIKNKKPEEEVKKEEKIKLKDYFDKST